MKGEKGMDLLFQGIWTRSDMLWLWQLFMGTARAFLVGILMRGEY